MLLLLLLLLLIPLLPLPILLLLPLLLLLLQLLLRVLLLLLLLRLLQLLLILPVHYQREGSRAFKDKGTGPSPMVCHHHAGRPKGTAPEDWPGRTPRQFRLPPVASLQDST